MNRTILTSNKTYGNTAFLSAEIQNKIYDACETAEQLGLDFTYGIRNGEHSNGDFVYTHRGEEKILCYNPVSDGEKEFLNKIKAVLFDLIAERQAEQKQAIIDKLAEYMDAIFDELNSDHDETTKATNLYFLRGEFFGLLEVFHIMGDLKKYCALAEEVKELENKAIIVCDDFYQKARRLNK